MAKRRPPISLSEMEERLGHTAAELSDSDDEEQRFYSDLSPISKDRYEKTRRELDEYIKLTNKGAFSSTEEESFSGPGLVQVGSLAFRILYGFQIYMFAENCQLSRLDSVGAQK